VHFDRVGSAEVPRASHRDFAAEELLGREDLEREDREAEADDDGEGETEAAGPSRQGLPARFKMRHSRHYVDELLGDKPLRTVREIPVSEIEPPEDFGPLETFERFEHSIREFGVLEPLLVGRSGAQYRVIAGMRRLRAAHKLGLGTVPCLVHDVDEEKLRDMREAATQRPSATPPAPELDATLLPAISDRGAERLRWSVMTDLAGIEVLREKIQLAAADILARTETVDRAPADCASLVSDVVGAVATEARLRGVRIDVNVTGGENGVSLDAALCRTALTALLQCLLAVAPREGTTLAIQALVTSVRPAFILQCVLKEADVENGSEPAMIGRFFDADWREHPCGAPGAQMLAAVSKVARLHGGRVEAQPRSPKGCAVIFVLPRPLSDL
jgi:ParB/Sulfiredoxin domain